MALANKLLGRGEVSRVCYLEARITMQRSKG